MAEQMVSLQSLQTSRLEEKLARELGTKICGFLKEPHVIEIMLNPDGSLWVERLGDGIELVESNFSPTRAEGLIGTIAAHYRTAVTRENPIIECELPLDGSRFEAMIPPVVSAPCFTIRRKATRIFTLDDYVETNIMTSAQAEVIKQAVVNKQNILVVGGTGTGKTTLTNAIIDHMAEVVPEDRLVIIEDTAEIQCRSPNKVILRANSNIDMLRLLKATMRLRPDRILVGEVRGGEALSLLKAWNTGHAGGVATVHANDAKSGLTRIEALIAEVSSTPMPSVIADAINIIISIAKTKEGRRVKEVIRVKGFGANGYDIEPI